MEKDTDRDFYLDAEEAKAYGIIGFSCSEDKDVNTTLPLPEYKEVSPFSWLKKILKVLLASVRLF